MLRDLQACYGDIKWRNACVHAKALLSTFEDSLEEICDWGRCQLLPSKLMHYRADSRSESIHYVLRQGWMCDRTPHYADELCHNVLLPFLESSIKRFVAMASDRLVRFVLKKTGQIDGDSSSSHPMCPRPGSGFSLFVSPDIRHLMHSMCHSWRRVMSQGGNSDV